MATKKHTFTIPIGDWSNDGHGKCEYYEATAAKPFKDVCKAFAKARKLWKLPSGSYFTPEDVCAEYEEAEVEEEVVEFLKGKGFKIQRDFWCRDMAELVVWFLNQGDPDLKAKLTPAEKERPTLRSWDFRKHVEQDLGSFGYGLIGG